MSARQEPATSHPGLDDVAFIDGPAFAAAVGISMSTLHERVRLKQAPAPVIRQPRFTRWRLADARAYLLRLAEEAALNPEPGIALVARAKRANTERNAKRAAAAASALATKEA